MKLQLIETTDSTGHWLKIAIDGKGEHYWKLDVSYRTNEEALKLANETMQFIWENGTSEKILKEYETKVSE